MCEVRRNADDRPDLRGGVVVEPPADQPVEVPEGHRAVLPGVHADGPPALGESDLHATAIVRDEGEQVKVLPPDELLDLVDVVAHPKQALALAQGAFRVLLGLVAEEELSVLCFGKGDD